MELLKRTIDLAMWPPGWSQEQALKAIYDLCGCAGKWNCHCVSVENNACGNAWEKWNERRNQTREAKR